jgi:hypothetical protein
MLEVGSPRVGEALQDGIGDSAQDSMRLLVGNNEVRRSHEERKLYLGT